MGDLSDLTTVLQYSSAVINILLGNVCAMGKSADTSDITKQNFLEARKFTVMVVSYNVGIENDTN